MVSIQPIQQRREDRLKEYSFITFHVEVVEFVLSFRLHVRLSIGQSTSDLTAKSWCINPKHTLAMRFETFRQKNWEMGIVNCVNARAFSFQNNGWISTLSSEGCIQIHSLESIDPDLDFDQSFSIWILDPQQWSVIGPWFYTDDSPAHPHSKERPSSADVFHLPPTHGLAKLPKIAIKVSWSPQSVHRKIFNRSPRPPVLRRDGLWQDLVENLVDKGKNTLT